MADFPNGARGANPFLSLLGALGSGLQDYMQGREFKDREAIQQQQLSDDRLSNQLKAAPLLQQLIQSDPTLRKNPQFVQRYNQTLGTNYQGQLPETVGGIPFTDVLVNHPDAINALQDMDPTMRTQADVGISGLPQGFNAASTRPTPDQAIRALNMLREQYQPYAMGWLDPNSPQGKGIQQQIAALSQYVPGLTPQQAPASAPGLGARGTATVNSLNAGTDQKKSTTSLNQSKKNLVDKQVSWFNTQAQAKVDNWNALTNLRNQQASAVPKEVQARLTQASSAAQRAQADADRTSMQVQSFQKLGLTPQALQAYSGVLNSMQQNANQQRTAVTSITNSIASILKANNGNDPAPNTAAGETLAFLRQSLAHHNDQYNSTIQQMQGLQQGRQHFAKQVFQRMGLPSNYTVGSKSVPASQQVEDAVKYLSQFPKAKAIDILRTSSLPAKEKGEVLRRLAGKP